MTSPFVPEAGIAGRMPYAAPDQWMVLPLGEENPWPGLEAFREEDEALFYGREDEAEELHWEVQRARLTVLFGLSGLGKTSLLRAGLYPRLRADGAIPVHIRMDYSEWASHPSAQVVRRVLGEALPLGLLAPRDPMPRSSLTLWEMFHYRGMDQRSAQQSTWVVVFDQFEELFTLGGAAAREWARDQLADLIEARVPRIVKQRFEANPGEAAAYALDSNYKVVLSLREDFLPELEELRERIPSIGRNRLRLRKLNGDQALTVVEQPRSRQVPPLVDKAVAPDVVRFVAGAAPGSALAELQVDPTLLSLFCRELNYRRLSAAASQITRDILQGNAGEILGGFYERSIGDEAPGVRRLIEESLLTRAGFRDSIALDNALAEPDVTEEAIDRLVNRRLLRVEVWGEQRRLELTHDVLTRVVRASRDQRRAREATERAEAAQREATAREAEARKKIVLGRVLIGSGIVIALSTIVALWANWELAIPVVQALLASEGNQFRLPVTVPLIQFFRFAPKYFWAGLLGGVVYLWIRRKKGVPWALQLAAGPVIALVTIIGLLALIAISLEYSIWVPSISGMRNQARADVTNRYAEVERAMRGGEYETALAGLDSIYDERLAGSYRGRVHNRVLRAEAALAAGDSAGAALAFDAALKEARGGGGSADSATVDGWVRYVEARRAAAQATPPPFDRRPLRVLPR